ncbi:MAG: hypothetical protein R3E50_14395 [Halioglobus sp.]
MHGDCDTGLQPLDQQSGATRRYLSIAPFLLQTTWWRRQVPTRRMSSRASPIDSPEEHHDRGSRGGLFRNSMIGLQFAISIFMLASVLVMYFQNKLVEEKSEIFPKSTIVTLDRVGVEDVRQRQELLQRELLAIPGVENVAFSSQVPYEQSTSKTEVARESGDKAASLLMNTVSVDPNFMSTYDIPLLQGRGVSRDIALDIRTDNSVQVNAVLSRLSAIWVLPAMRKQLAKFFSIPGESDDDGPVQYHRGRGSRP